MKRLRATLFIQPGDLLAEGAMSVMAAARTVGAAAVALATPYHAYRDVLRHPGRIRIEQSPGGAAHVPDPHLYPSGEGPSRLPGLGSRDLLSEAGTAAGEAGLSLDVWAVFLHDDRGGQRAGAVVNAFGEAYTDLRCPAGTGTLAYVVGLVEDLCRYRPGRIFAEGLHWYPLAHGHHHERLEWIPPRAADLLALCFCDGCRLPAEAAGVDVDTLRQHVRDAVDAELGGSGDLQPPPLVELLGPYLSRRSEVVELLATQCRQRALTHGVELVFVDLAAGMSGWVDGRSTGPLGVRRARDLGIDIAKLSRRTRVAPAVYASSSARFRRELSAYRRHGVDGPVIIRPGAPDVTSPEGWARRLEDLTESGIEEIGLYQYRFLTATELQRLGETLGTAGPG